MTAAIRRLEGWMTYPEAAERLGYRKQGFHQLVNSSYSPFDPDTDLRCVGKGKVLLVRTAAVDEEVSRRRAAGRL